jgi:polysaccharide chain length determinant protein (PEP-CTERM system associated)
LTIQVNFGAGKMDQQQNQQIRRYLDLFVRWQAFIIAAILISLPSGLLVYLNTQKVYQASSLLSYQQQKVSPNKMSPDMEAAIRDVVSSLTQIVTSRSNLEELITTLDLYPEARKKLPMEDVVDLMRRDIQIEPSKQGDIFKILYSGSNPEKVVKVTNALAAKFIEENLKYREERATETSAYTSDELAMAKETMDQKEAAMRDYKLKHYNELPEQRQTNVSRLIALQEQYQLKQESIQDLEKTMILVQDQISNRRKLMSAQSELAVDGGKGQDGSTSKEAAVSPADRLIQLRGLLKSLEMKYTENHPEVRRTKKQIARLEESLAGGDSAIGESEDVSSTSLGDSADPVLLQLETQVKNIQLGIENINQEKEDLKKTISQYEEWVAAAPVREAEWSALTREYGELRRHYDLLVSSDLQAKSMLNLERRQKGSQFKIEDAARLPEKPVKPDFFKIIGIALVCGAGIGFGIPFARAFLDASFRDVVEIESFLGMHVVCTIPLVQTDIEKTWQKRKLYAGATLAIFLFLLIVALFAYCWRRGMIVV